MSKKHAEKKQPVKSLKERRAEKQAGKLKEQEASRKK